MASNYPEFEKFMKLHVHVFDNIMEFIDEYHYNPEKNNDYDIYNDINECVYFDIDPKCLKNKKSINEFKYSDFAENYSNSFSNFIRNKELHSRCVEYFQNLEIDSNLNIRDKLLINIYNLIVS